LLGRATITIYVSADLMITEKGQYIKKSDRQKGIEKKGITTRKR
jgi:hypothetical protein